MDYKHTYRRESVRMHHSFTEAPDKSNFERHCHNDYEIIYVVSGQGKYIVESNEYPLLPGTVILLAPFEYHYVIVDADRVYERYVINFDRDYLQSDILSLPLFGDDGASGYGKYFSSEQVSDSIKSAFESLEEFSLIDSDAVSGGMMIQSTLTHILLLLSKKTPTASGEKDNALVSRVIEYLNTHISEALSLDELSHKFYISKYRLCHAFRECTGLSVISYLNTKRIALARKLIEDGGQTSDVCYRVGFRDYSVFYRAFKHQTGISPVKVKKRG